MKKKYVISKNESKNEILIKEFAELDKDILSMICEETFRLNHVRQEMLKGKHPLMSALRTQNMYPPGVYAEKIATAVVELINMENSQPVELFFDDMSLISKNQDRPSEVVSLKVRPVRKDSEEIDDLLEDEIEDEFDDDPSMANLDSPLRIADDDVLDIEDEV